MPLVRSSDRQCEVPGDGTPTPGALLAALRGGSPPERRSAARELSTYAQTAPMLCAQLGTEQDASVRGAILTSLIRQHACDVVEGLLPYLRSDDVWLRNAAIEALQTMPDMLAPYIEGLLADADSDVRILAVNVLAAVPDGRVARWLKQVVGNDPHANVCAAAVDGLAEIGDETAIPPLASLAGRFPNEPFIAFASSVAIRRIRGR